MGPWPCYDAAAAPNAQALTNRLEAIYKAKANTPAAAILRDAEAGLAQNQQQTQAEPTNSKTLISIREPSTFEKSPASRTFSLSEIATMTTE